MINEFTKTKFFLSVAHKQIYESGFNFNESNIIAYLAELEEYIAILITYLATKRDDPSAPFALVPLDKLDTKNHFKKDLAVSAFSGNVLLFRSKHQWAVLLTKIVPSQEAYPQPMWKPRSPTRSSCTRLSCVWSRVTPSTSSLRDRPTEAGNSTRSTRVTTKDLLLPLQTNLPI